MVHAIKCEQEYFVLAQEGIKTFEVRYNDRNYTVGDILVLCELDHFDKLTGQTLEFYVDYVFDDDRFLLKNFVILSIKRIP